MESLFALNRTIYGQEAVGVEIILGYVVFCR